jgi:hypothetical protein
MWYLYVAIIVSLLVSFLDGFADLKMNFWSIALIGAGWPLLLMFFPWLLGNYLGDKNER